MTVEHLIKELSKYNKDKIVVLSDSIGEDGKHTLTDYTQQPLHNVGVSYLVVSGLKVIPPYLTICIFLLW